eukprot:6177498-Pleurochrysis_carterae.AAC.2
MALLPETRERIGQARRCLSVLGGGGSGESRACSSSVSQTMLSAKHSYASRRPMQALAKPAMARRADPHQPHVRKVSATLL